uniref:Uncharacterized protein n=1 Tax=Oryza barthii TaxID=65489 RepID=A0A0D3GYI8_9ORYZ
MALGKWAFADGMYYRRQRKASSEANANVFMPGGPNGISFPASNRAHDWGYGGVGEEWETSYARKLQLMNFLSALHQRTANSLKDSSAIIVLDSDDEDEYTEGCEQLTSENNKQQAPSGPTSPYTTWIVSSTKDQVNGTLHVDGVQSTQIVPYGQNAPLINQFPLQTSWQPSIQYERVILQKRPEEQRVQDLVAASHADKIAETQVLLTLPTLPTLPNERKRRKTEPTTLVDVDGGTNLGKRKRKNHQNQAAVDSNLDLQQNDVPSQSYRTMIEEEKPVKESEGLEDLWKDFSLAAECTKIEYHCAQNMSNEKDVDDENEMDDDCNHDIRIHEDLGHVCRICGMIVRKAETIIDYQWKKRQLLKPQALDLIILDTTHQEGLVYECSLLDSHANGSGNLRLTRTSNHACMQISVTNTCSHESCSKPAFSKTKSTYAYVI